MTDIILGSKDVYPSVRIANTIIAICAVTGIFALVVVILRLYTKWRYVKIKWDDRFMTIAMVRLMLKIFPQLD
jgi:hypothetical protein